MTNWPPISRDDLKAAAKSAGFDLVFPELIRRLIAETAGGLTSIDVPSSSGTAAGGFDGVVEARSSTAFVPDGVSVWELSVGGGLAKADDDYTKRLSGPPGTTMADVTYVEVILEPWTKARTWTAEKRAEGRWRRVEGYNLDRVSTWLEHAPATTAWLAGHLGRALPGVRDLMTWWSESWLPSTTVELDRELVLAGREAAAKRLVEMIDSEQRVISLGGELPPDETAAFTAAAILDATTPEGLRRSSTALLISDATSLVQLAALAQPMIFVLHDAALARGVPFTTPHQMILTASQGAASLEVPRPDSEKIREKLQGHVSDDDLYSLGALARRSLLALRRRFAHHPELLAPTWASEKDIVLRRMLLIGKWRGPNGGDRKIVAELMGSDYADVEARARSLSEDFVPPFVAEINGIWHVVTLEDAWSLKAKEMSVDDLEAFRAAALTVLGEEDPVLAMPPEEQYLAGVRGIGREHSSVLREGIAQGLALLGSSAMPVSGAGSTTTATFARLIVRELLETARDDSTYRTWHSLADVLSELGEAAPEEFLKAVAAGFGEGAAAHEAMFADPNAGDDIFSRTSLHTYFLWALERLAWSRDYIDEVVEMLGGLADIDPGGRTTNRPINSLTGILSVWCPNTSADVEDRIRCIRSVVERHPSVAPELLLGLIPDGRGMQMAHPTPRFRDWGRLKRPTADEMRTVLRVVVSELSDLASSDAVVAATAVDKLGDLEADMRQELLNAIERIGVQKDLEPVDRAKLFHTLRRFVARHKEYADAFWALPDDVIREIEGAMASIAPADPFDLNAWMFESDWIEIGSLKRRDDYEAYEAEALRLRTQVVQDILKASGLPGVMGFAVRVGVPEIVGAALANSGWVETDELLPHLATDGKEYRTVHGYFSFRIRGAGNALLADELIARAPDGKAKARLLRMLTNPSDAWARLNALNDEEVTSLYWAEFPIYGLGADFNDSTAVGWKLLGVDRAASAVMLVSLYMRRSRESGLAEAKLVAAAMDRLLEMTEIPESEKGFLREADLARVFSLLADYREELGRGRVIRLEWNFFHAMGFEATAPSLHDAVVTDPDFFVELVEKCFRPSSAKGEHIERTEQERAVSERAFEVLRTCRRCPGFDTGGVADPEALQAWTVAARERLAEIDRKAIGDQQIGDLFANAPTMDGGAPLHASVRDLVEKIRSDDLETGIYLGIVNSRGVTSKGLYDGGAQELELADKYRTWAEEARGWPRVRKLLMAVAESYEADARREELSAEARRRGLGL